VSLEKRTPDKKAVINRSSPVTAAAVIGCIRWHQLLEDTLSFGTLLLLVGGSYGAGSGIRRAKESFPVD
jgi:hypothetical protein